MNDPQAKRRVQALPPSPRPRVTRSATSATSIKAKVDLSSVSSSTTSSSSRASPTPAVSSRLKASHNVPPHTPSHPNTHQRQPRTLRTQSSTSWDTSKQSSPSVLAASKSPPSSPSARIARARVAPAPTPRPHTSRAQTHTSSVPSTASRRRSNSSASLSASASSSISTSSSQQHPNPSVPAISNVSPSTPTSSSSISHHHHSSSTSTASYPLKNHSTPRIDSKSPHHLDADGTPRNPYAPAHSLLRQQNVPLSPWVSVRAPKQHMHEYNPLSPTLIASGVPLPDSSSSESENNDNDDDDDDGDGDVNTAQENGESNSNGETAMGVGTDFEIDKDPDFDLEDADKMSVDEWRVKWRELQLAKECERRALNRKILDLEIRAASLMSVNTSLEHARERQASELRLLRRRMRRDAPLVRPVGADGNEIGDAASTGGDKDNINDELAEDDEEEEDDSEEEEVRIKLMQGDDKFRNAMEIIESMMREAELSVSSKHTDSYDGGTIRRAKVRVSEDFS